MRGWVKANGGPLALVLVGVGFLGLETSAVGLSLVGIGAVWFVLTLNPVQRKIPFAVVRKSDRAEQRLSDRTLGRHCLALADELGAEVADYRRDDPRTAFWGMGPVRASEAAIRKQQRTENEYRAKFAARFSLKYARRVGWLLHEVEHRGLADAHTVWRVSHVASMPDEHTLAELVTLLGIVGHQLTEEDDPE